MSVERLAAIAAPSVAGGTGGLAVVGEGGTADLTGRPD
jgi:hypothetical protein